MALPQSETGLTSGAPGVGQRLESRDVTGLLHLMAELACVRNDPRRWRMEALTALCRTLPAAAAAAVIVRVGGDEASCAPTVVSVFDVGFRGSAEHEAFMNEFNEAPFQDPLSKKALQAARSSDRTTITVLRHELVDDGEWYSSANVEKYRRVARVDSCVMSVHRCSGGGRGAKREEGACGGGVGG